MLQISLAESLAAFLAAAMIVMLSHNSLSDLSVLGTSVGVSFADSEHTGLLLGETDERSRLFSHPGSLGSVSLEGDTNLTSDGGLGLSEVFGGDSGVLGKHSSRAWQLKTNLCQ